MEERERSRVKLCGGGGGGGGWISGGGGIVLDELMGGKGSFRDKE